MYASTRENDNRIGTDDLADEKNPDKFVRSTIRFSCR